MAIPGFVIGVSFGYHHCLLVPPRSHAWISCVVEVRMNSDCHEVRSELLLMHSYCPVLVTVASQGEGPAFALDLPKNTISGRHPLTALPT